MRIPASSYGRHSESVGRRPGALPSGRPAVPLVLQRPAGADRPRLDAVGEGDRLELAVARDGVELGSAAQALERGPDAGADALGLVERAGPQQPAELRARALDDTT